MLKIGEKGGHLLATGRGKDWLEAVALVVIVEKRGETSTNRKRRRLAWRLSLW
jgi:hypothetical protein